MNGSDASSFAEICGCCPSQGPYTHLALHSYSLELTGSAQSGESSGSSKPSCSSRQASSSASSRSRCALLGAQFHLEPFAEVWSCVHSNRQSNRRKTRRISCLCLGRAPRCNSYLPRYQRRCCVLWLPAPFCCVDGSLLDLYMWHLLDWIVSTAITCLYQPVALLGGSTDRMKNCTTVYLVLPTVNVRRVHCRCTDSFPIVYVLS